MPTLHAHWPLRSQDYNAGNRSAKLDSKQVPSLDEALWGRRPAKLLGTGIGESDRKHLASVRRYLHYHLHLLARVSDCERLQAAVQCLRLPATQAQVPGSGDLLRCACDLCCSKHAAPQLRPLLIAVQIFQI